MLIELINLLSYINKTSKIYFSQLGDQMYRETEGQVLSCSGFKYESIRRVGLMSRHQIFWMLMNTDDIDQYVA